MDIPTEAPEGWGWAWFSPTQSRSCRTPRMMLVKHVDGRDPTVRESFCLRWFGLLEDGTEVEYSQISPGPDHGTLFDDIEFVGLIRPDGRRSEHAPYVEEFKMDKFKVEKPHKSEQ